MRWESLVIAVALVTAGCIGGVGERTGAKDELETAKDAADQRLDDPRLVEVWGIEPLHKATSEDGGMVIHADQMPGDGNAPGWSYHFRDGQAHLYVVVASGIGVLAEAWENETDDDDEEPDQPIEGWEVEAPEVADTLAENASWPDIQDNQTVTWHLAMVEDTPVWEVTVHQGTGFFFGDTVARATVDASTGEIIEVRGASWYGHDHRHEHHANASYGYGEDGYGAGDGGCDSDEADGLVSPATDPLTAEIEMGGTGTIELSVDHGNLVGQVNLTLEHGGQAVFEQTLPEQAGVDGGDWTTTLADMPPGDYAATLASGQDGGVGDETLEIRGTWGTAVCMDVGCDGTDVDRSTASQAPGPLAGTGQAIIG